MMRIVAYIGQDENGNTKSTVTLDRSITMSGKERIYVKKATIFWNYNNVVTGLNDTAQVVGAETITVPEGYYTNESLAEYISSNTTSKIAFFTVDETGKGSVVTPSDGKDVNLGKLGMLLGFEENAVAVAGTPLLGGEGDINRGLKFINVKCSIANKSSNIDVDGKRGTSVSSLPICETTLKGSVTRYVDVESYVTADGGTYSSIDFEVVGSNGSTKLGSVLLEMYIS